jgi:hypothetical protein
MSRCILQGKRVLITQADAFRCPVLCQVFVEQGASVMANTQSLIDPHAPAAVIAAAGWVDVLVTNLALPAPSTPAMEVTDTEWREKFAALVEPKSGVVIALACGTSYALRIPQGKRSDALAADCKQGQRWSSGGSTDAETQFGIGWVFGGWAKEEGGWLREVVEEVQTPRVLQT